ncbi:MAG: ABC transporter ATP-binding protein [Christensenellales bacterium]|jgi:Fe-S cluster assembly ATP-binding protein
MLEIQNLAFGVMDEAGQPLNILTDIHLKVFPGSFVAITGPNGSGKSSLARVIMGIEQSNQGRIFFDGKDITGMDIHQRAQAGIGFAFQQPVRFKGMQVRDLLRLSARHKLSIDEACDYLSQVGLCAKDYIFREMNSSLSGGEMKRIEIAMLMARKVRLSLFDEPEAGIDLWSFSNLIQVFEKLREQTQGAIIVISHQERILKIADRIIVMEEGRITRDGSRQEVLPHLMLEIDACPFYGRSVVS